MLQPPECCFPQHPHGSKNVASWLFISGFFVSGFQWIGIQAGLLSSLGGEKE